MVEAYTKGKQNITVFIIMGYTVCDARVNPMEAVATDKARGPFNNTV